MEYTGVLQLKTKLDKTIQSTIKVILLFVVVVAVVCEYNKEFYK